MELQIGDRVKIIANLISESQADRYTNYVGQIGKIVSISGNQFKIDINKEGFETVLWKKDELELVANEIVSYEIGDFIKVTDKDILEDCDELTENKAYEVIDILNYETLNSDVVILNDSRESYELDTNFVEKVETEIVETAEEIKVGDFVKVKNEWWSKLDDDHNLIENKAYEVKEVLTHDDFNDDITIYDEIGQELKMDIETIEKVETPVETEFIIGDRVKIIKDIDGNSGIYLNLVGTITHFHEIKNEFEIELDEIPEDFDNEALFCTKEELELVVETEIVETAEEIPAESIQITDFSLKNLIKTEFQGIEKDQVKLFHYIDNMSKAFGKDISEMDLKEIFPFEENTLKCDENEINEILFKLDIEVKEKAKFEIDEQILKIIDKNGQEYIKKQKEELDGKIRMKKNQYKHTIEVANGQFKTMLEFKRQKEDLQANFTEQMKKSLDDIDGNVWEFKKSSRMKLYFVCKEDIVLTHKKPNIGLDLKVNFGKLGLIIDLQTMILTGFQEENNLNSRNYFHPHLDEHGEICEGNIASQMSEFKENYNIGGILDLYYQLITNYNEESPWQSIEEFAVKSKQIQPNGEVLEKDDIVEENEEREYEFNCPDCDYYLTEDIDSREDYEYRDCPDCGCEIESNYNEY